MFELGFTQFSGMDVRIIWVRRSHSIGTAQKSLSVSAQMALSKLNDHTNTFIVPPLLFLVPVPVSQFPIVYHYMRLSAEPILKLPDLTPIFPDLENRAGRHGPWLSDYHHLCT